MFLVLAALLHAGWNLLSKRSEDKLSFLWLSGVAVCVVFLPPFLYVYRYQPPAPDAWGYILLSALFEAIYFILLANAYQRADLSLIYPVARGSAPLFVALFASIMLGERLSVAGIAGIALIVLGIYTINLRSLSLNRHGLLAPLLSMRDRALQLALLTGVAIATYSVVDKVGIQYASPPVYTYLILLMTTLMLAPYVVVVKRKLIVREWQSNRWSILLVAVMTVLTFSLVLVALSFSKVSYVSAVREVSVVIAALLGTIVLREPFGKAKVAGAALIFAGIMCIGFAR